jgi:hypothetical protein
MEGVAEIDLAAGIAMRVSIPSEDGRLIEMTCVAPADATPDGLDLLLDKMVRAGNRQKALARLPELRTQLEQHQEKIVGNKGIIARRNAEVAARKEMREEERQKLRLQLNQLTEVAEVEHRNSGRRLAFDPAKVQTLKPPQRSIDQLDEMDRKDEAEAIVANSGNQNEIIGDERTCALIRKMIAECERQARGEDISGVSSE